MRKRREKEEEKEEEKKRRKEKRRRRRKKSVELMENEYNKQINHYYRATESVKTILIVLTNYTIYLNNK